MSFVNIDFCLRTPNLSKLIKNAYTLLFISFKTKQLIFKCFSNEYSSVYNIELYISENWSLCISYIRWERKVDLW